MKKISSLVLALVLCSNLIGCSSNDKSSTDANTQDRVESVDSTEDSKSKLKINITGGQKGKYGSEIVLNANTEFENKRIVYHIPAGTYTVTNKGKNMNQFTIYSDKTVKTEEGWEEPAESIFVKLIDVNASEEFTITDTQYIYVMDGNWQIIEK